MTWPSALQPRDKNNNLIATRRKIGKITMKVLVVQERVMGREAEYDYKKPEVLIRAFLNDVQQVLAEEEQR